MLNSRMEKLHFAFRMYDLDGDDKISKVWGYIFIKSSYLIESIFSESNISRYLVNNFLSDFSNSESQSICLIYIYRKN